MIDRRTCVLASLIGLSAGWGHVLAQSGSHEFRVGVLRQTAPPSSPQDPAATFLPKALAELGYVEGRNLVIEARRLIGDVERLPALAREPVQVRVDVVIAVAVSSVRAAVAASSTVPVVFFGNFDPVALGLVPNLARPGGNVAGILISPDGTLAGKKLELLRSAVPSTTRVGYLAPAADPATRLQRQEVERAAKSLGLELVSAEVRDGDYARAFAALAAQRPGALFVGASTVFMRDRAQIIALAAKHRQPAMYEWREQVEDGGLMAYSTNLYGLYQRIGAYVDRILKGAKPGDLPVERPSKFDFVVNLKTARALGLVIPQAVLLRADEVIQ
ncbi:MAG: ABC transporter substrate-binding protein [Rhodoferax sp.]|nr:ABC transporter substrate-binding protein [Rhodoferax sp.]